MSKFIISNVELFSMDPSIGHIDRGFIAVEGQKICHVGAMEALDTRAIWEDTEDVELVDGEGLLAYPGFIDAHSHLGMFDDHLGWEGSDGNEATDPVTPELRAIDSIFHDDVTLEESIAGGVTTVMTGPGSANVIGGQFAIIKPYGPSVDQMILKAPAAMKAALGDNPKMVYGRHDKKPQTRMGNAAVLREALMKARDYVDRKAKDPDKTSFDFRMEALAPVIRRELPLKIHCHRADDILTAIRISDEFGIRYTLDHCTEGYLILDQLVDAYAYRNEEHRGSLEGIIVGPLVGDRSKPELSRKWNGSAAAIYETGIPMAVATDHPVIPIDFGRHQVSALMRDGLSREAALESITTKAAMVLGVDDRVGRLAPGMDADIVLWDQDPLLPWANTDRVYLNGKLVYEADF